MTYIIREYLTRTLALFFNMFIWFISTVFDTNSLSSAGVPLNDENKQTQLQLSTLWQWYDPVRKSLRASLASFNVYSAPNISPT